jgi:hypothetical protein
MPPRSLILAGLAFASASFAFGQGETTSAIAGEVSDATGAGIAGANIIVIRTEDGSKRSAAADQTGRFLFPQLKPGSYTVRAAASGFEEQSRAMLTAGLGQTQTVNFVLNVAANKENIVVTSDAPLINTENPNTATTLNAKAIENLPNPGSDLTYPAQFAPGALINTAGSSNDFVGGSNGYGNVQFNGLPALSNAYIVDGLETNDPLTNLNSGLSTNLVLGLNSIAEVTVNTTSYAVDQGRYGAAQINYITKSGGNSFHGNLYELWNGSHLNAADYFTNSTPGNQKPRSDVNHFGGSLGGPIVHDKLFFFFDGEWLRIALPIVTPVTVPSVQFQNYVLSQLPLGGIDPVTGTRYPAQPQLVPFYQQDVRALPEHCRHAVAGARLSAGCGSMGCANRVSVSQSSDDHEQVFTARVDHNHQRRIISCGTGSRPTPACRLLTPIPSIHCSTPHPRSRSIRSRPGTRIYSPRRW